MREGKANRNREQTALGGSTRKASQEGLNLFVGVADPPRPEEEKPPACVGGTTNNIKRSHTARSGNGTLPDPAGGLTLTGQDRKRVRRYKVQNRAPLSPALAPQPIYTQQ
ncbi:hypothetical protein NDU88_003696 [Pleurodeles waltl]|uniref:Uncharacterized protein n=1 Tax=Pleurodeles waltl TaxID=8319 RepID=A0AAV7QFN1_PLEWA|nr:hypothetical protein NDU88_003696 [Pleurodeles waltl]